MSEPLDTYWASNTPGYNGEQAVVVSESFVDNDDDVTLNVEGYPTDFFLELEACGGKAPEVGAVLVVRITDRVLPGYPYLRYHEIVKA